MELDTVLLFVLVVTLVLFASLLIGALLDYILDNDGVAFFITTIIDAILLGLALGNLVI